MKTQRNILTAFILNSFFSVFEFIGGIMTGSVAIVSDAVHDAGDAVSIGVSYFLEKASKRQPDGKYTYGYGRYSVIGGFITTFILLAGSVGVICNAVNRIINPAEINYNGMIVFAVVGVCVNACSAFFTHGGHSVNQKAVNLHMLEDVLGWVVVLTGSVVMKFTDFTLIDPIMSMGVAIFILVNAVKNLKEVLNLILEKAPHDVDVEEIGKHIAEIEGVSDVHHIHIWSMDGQNNYATMHVVTEVDTHIIKEKIRTELRSHGIGHATIETETTSEHCHEKTCRVECVSHHPHSHHHHHH